MKKPFHAAVFISIIAPLVYFAVTAYLGSFSRYLADDYCEAERVNSSSPFNAVIERYSLGTWRSANRYSNILFVGFSEWLGKNNMQFTISLMVILWFAGLVWSIFELRKFLKIGWHFQVDLFLGLFFGFMSMVQAPNLFQTVYWRSSMMTHFAPLVFGSFLFAFVVKQARRAEQHSPALFIYFFIFAATFVIAGFSEPPTTTLLTALPLLMLAIWLWGKSPLKQKYLTLLASALAGALLGLLVMVFSPAGAIVAQDRTLNIFELLGNSFLYSQLFMTESLKVLPLPTILSALMPLMLVWLYRQTKSAENSQQQSLPQKNVVFIIILIPFLAWLLIAAGFSPSVYGQGYPVERMRFLARSIMIALFILEGALFGALLGRAPFKPNPALGQWLVVTVFVTLSIIYPLRAALNIYKLNAKEYSQRAVLWDLRNAYIIRHAALGEKDILVPGFSGVHQIKELDSRPTHWVNVCAAQYYDIDSILSATMPRKKIVEYLNE